MATTVNIDNLQVGMFVHLDLGWWAHPFALSSFLIESEAQITTIRGLGRRELRWSPDKSRLPAQAAPATAQTPAAMTIPLAADTVATAATAATAGQALAAGSAHQDTRPISAMAWVETPLAAASPQAMALAQQQAATQRCCEQVAEARSAWVATSKLVASRPTEALAMALGLSAALLDKLMVEQDMCVRVLSQSPADPVAGHALNVTVISLLMGRIFGLSRPEMQDLGVGALLHDIGKLELDERAQHADGLTSPSELQRYQEHVAFGIVQGCNMGLSPGALAVLAQHHEMADGSGFPRRLAQGQISLGARIVALVNRYDNLCNPRQAALALTPHEALSMLFAQCRAKFDGEMLNAFIRMMGVYPPGSVVQLTDDRYASVVSVNSSRPLKPRVLVCDPAVPAEHALLLNLDGETHLGIRRSVKPAQLPVVVRDYLVPCQRMVYFFEPLAAPTAAPTVAPAAAATASAVPAPAMEAQQA